MKVNGLLFLILVGLIFFTYQFEEKEFKKKLIPTDRVYPFKNTIFNKIKLHNLELEKNNDWVIMPHKFNTNQAVYELISAFKSLSCEKVKVMTQSSMNFEINGEKYSLGNISPISGEFYLQTPTERLICLHEGKTQKVYKDQKESYIYKYEMLKGMITADQAYFINRNIVDESFRTQLASVKIDNVRNRWFTLDFVRKAMHPIAPSEIELKDLKKVFQGFLDQVQVHNIFTAENENDLQKKQANLTFNQKINWDLFYEFKNRQGLFIKKENDPFVYEISSGGQKVFFLNVQDFWKKKIFKNMAPFLTSKDIKLDIKVKNKSYQFILKDFKSFKVVNKSKSIQSLNQNYFNFLFNLIFNLSSFSEASYIDHNEIKESDKMIELNILGKTLFLTQTRNIIKIYWFEAGLSFYFLNNVDIPLEKVITNLFTVKN